MLEARERDDGQSERLAEVAWRTLKHAPEFLRSLGALAIGHVVGRLCSLVLLALVGRELGAEALGELALGQTLSQYVRMGSEFGTTQIGARLVARRRASARDVLSVIVRKRAVLTLIAALAGCAYALKGPVPAGVRDVLVVFAVAGSAFGFSLEWLMWGLEKYGAIASSQVGIAIIYLLGAVGAITVGARRPLIWIALAYGVAVVFGALLVWAMWRTHPSAPVQPHIEALHELAPEAGWGPVAILGSAVLVNQLFQTLDVFLLGALSTAAQLGLYSAGRRILFTIFGIYYMVTQAAFPIVARTGRTSQRHRALVATIVGVVVAGSVVAAVTAIYARQILVLIYGPRLDGAATALRVLALTCPLEFGAAMLSIVFVADGRNGVLLGALGFGAVADAAANLLWVPHHGAVGAAWAKLVSYAVLLAAMQLLAMRQSRTEAAASSKAGEETQRLKDAARVRA